MGGPSLAGTREAGDQFCCSITGARTDGLRRLAWGPGLWAVGAAPGDWTVPCFCFWCLTSGNGLWGLFI